MPVEILIPGDAAAADPFTIAFIANPALERNWGSGVFVPDPILQARSAYEDAVAHSMQCILGQLPSQAERIFDAPELRDRTRVVSLFPELPSEDPNSLVGERDRAPQLVPRRDQFVAFAAKMGFTADIFIAISASPSHEHATSFPADDGPGPGVAFVLDGKALVHRHRSTTPGCTALHVTERGITALHEFQHAISSFDNGAILDLYEPSFPANTIIVNKKRGRPIPADYGILNQTPFLSDATRGGIQYPAHWRTYHCALHFPAQPALMDRFDMVQPAHACVNDEITRRFVQDRLRARMSR